MTGLEIIMYGVLGGVLPEVFALYKLRHIKKGEKIGRLSDPFSNDNSTTITSHFSGIVIGINRSPLIQEGSSIFKIASFIDNKQAEAELEEWGEQNIALQE